jgi:hypothetical protein
MKNIIPIPKNPCVLKTYLKKSLPNKKPIPEKCGGGSYEYLARGGGSIPYWGPLRARFGGGGGCGRETFWPISPRAHPAATSRERGPHQPQEYSLPPLSPICREDIPCRLLAPSHK